MPATNENSAKVSDVRKRFYSDYQKSVPIKLASLLKTAIGIFIGH